MLVKKVIRVLSFALCLFLSTTVFAQPLYRVVVNGKLLQTEVPPQLVEGRLLVPLRAIAEGLGAQVSYDAGSSTAYISLAAGGPSGLEFNQALDQLYALEGLQNDVSALNMLADSFDNFYDVLYLVQGGSINVTQFDESWARLENQYADLQMWILDMQTQVSQLPTVNRTILDNGYLTPAQIVQQVDMIYSHLYQAHKAALKGNWDRAHAEAVQVGSQINYLKKAWLDYDLAVMKETFKVLAQWDSRVPRK